MTDDNGGASRGSGESASISLLSFTVGDNSSLGHSADWEDISYGEGCLSTSIDELTSVHSFNGDEVLKSLLESICISEGDLSEWCSSTWIVNNVLNNSLDISTIINIRMNHSDLPTLVSQHNREF